MTGGSPGGRSCPSSTLKSAEIAGRLMVPRAVSVASIAPAASNDRARSAAGAGSREQRASISSRRPASEAVSAPVPPAPARPSIRSSVRPSWRLRPSARSLACGVRQPRRRWQPDWKCAQLHVEPAKIERGRRRREVLEVALSLDAGRQAARDGDRPRRHQARGERPEVAMLDRPPDDEPPERPEYSGSP